MELIANFGPAWSKPRGYCDVAFLLPDARTSFGRVLLFSSQEAMIASLEKMKADVEQVRICLRSWGQGSAHVFLSPAQVEWLRPD